MFPSMAAMPAIDTIFRSTSELNNDEEFTRNNICVMDATVAPKGIEDALSKDDYVNTRLLFWSMRRDKLFWNSQHIPLNAIFLLYEPHQERVYNGAKPFLRKLLGFWKEGSASARQQVFIIYCHDQQPQCQPNHYAGCLAQCEQFELLKAGQVLLIPGPSWLWNVQPVLKVNI